LPCLLRIRQLVAAIAMATVIPTSMIY